MKATKAANHSKRAVIYIRVSTKQQAVRDGNPEGYSLPTQREACTKKAESLGATVVAEYIDKDSATSADKRPDFQRLVERVITDQDVDYVIVFKLDRFARNRRDDAVISMQLEAAGARLVSCVEAILMTRHGRPSQLLDEGGEDTGYRRSSGRQTGVLSLVGSKQNHLAERVGFEPTVPLPARQFSRLLP